MPKLFSVPFRFKGVHNCEAVVLTCIDFRYWRETVEFLEKELGLKVFDFPSLPGAAKAINESQGEDIAYQCISIPCSKHHVKIIVIINHQDCGAYDGSSKFNGDTHAEQEFHELELKKARDKELTDFPGKEVIVVYARLDVNQENVEFVIVE